MALTADLVARTIRAIENTGPPPDLVRNPETEWNAIIREMLATRPDGRDVWIFAYGSLLWNPAVEHVEERAGVVPGWHRSFCIRMRDWRGTVDQPGLMMGLDRGGQCRGMALRLAEDTVEAQLGKLVRREMPVRPSSKPFTHGYRWLQVQTSQGLVRAIAFVVNRKGGNYMGGLTLDETAGILARACGHAGSCAEYLHNTISQLEALGIRDRNLWRLQSLVADKLTSSHP
ncbi:gamma-glutamylcyclotransferase [Mesorhizobium sp. 131-2-1]|uniref:gamma-glutamylcyclotransferase n=1 Tax=Mesorhizobium sp. 131-2-1 TaxID=2744518 RepID=UPI001934BE83|nr:gamma-glutamylcyclotransferase [Mesorhizobium sp. 131-2-1]BCG95553.1 gamma-glutamylcyclotransferase [Mesorhizobium sp. 131-2-1]